ncbi:MAG: hypothetical protein KTV77_00790 [Wolbachia endosymbiont of Fragariocoptes setiger]|nr:hypothetical protein [Wolbachia endosymbiont of Fragariocoptes setiger]
MNNQEDISDLKLPNNFEIGETIEGDIGFLHIIVETLKQLRPDTLINIEFLSNELETNWNYLRNHDFSNSEIIPDCQPCSSHSINHTPKRRFNPEIEGKMICTKYDIKLHIIEKQKEETEGTYYHKVIDKSGSKFVKDVDYSDTSTIHILNKGDGYFSQIVNIATIRFMSIIYQNIAQG